MMTKIKKAKKKDPKYSSLIMRWVSIVSLTITGSFFIFSVFIYSTVSQQAMSQQSQVSEKVVDSLDASLNSIKNELEVSNVIPSLSPSTRRIIAGGPNISQNSNGESNSSAFSDGLISAISNPDISVAVYNLHNEVVFSNGDSVPKFHAFSGQDKWKKVKRGNNRFALITYHRIVSDETNKTTGYVVVYNQMTSYNNLMNNLLQWMIIISAASIIVFTVIVFFVVRDVVKPIKRMSHIAEKVNEDPNSDIRIGSLNRDDELEDLAVTFDSMLDRMQTYIDQQKQFVSDVSHELRTPVAVIEGHLNMLKRWGKDDPQILDESINSSVQQADRMKHLIQEMLDLTRAEQIDVQYPNAVCEVKVVLDRVVSDLQMVHPDFNIRLDLDDLPEYTDVKMYQGHLEQVLVILIDNAIKYSTNRKQINVDAGVTHNKISIEVQDFGEGISRENQAKIFNRFYRVDKARTREKGGNGLGLSIAKKLISSYNGKISVKSVEGQGSQFKIVLPLLSHKKAERLRQLDQNPTLEKPKGII